MKITKLFREDSLLWWLAFSHFYKLYIYIFFGSQKKKVELQQSAGHQIKSQAWDTPPGGGMDFWIIY